ncbi:MAG: 16S rRNA (cytidine(1402)-2'-O)-methyltransferase [Oscillospiraceae bacterium]|nr:16S rRNA (cytidine(1402)-2'-O)-methyltransferase [Oscillospiraceae bacterium]
MSGKLYVVGTPIGNMGDITERAAEVLRMADIIAAEDTRTSLKLLGKLGVRTKLVANHKFNEQRQVDYLIGELASGKNVAVISDAGTPCISDPGSILVKNAAKNGVEVIGVCGACAAVTALSVSGFSAPSFTFYGFFPRTAGDAAKALGAVSESGVPVAVWYESPHRIKKTMEYIAVAFPEGEVCLCNDLTKIFERIYRGTPGEVIALLDGNDSFEKGEYTLVLERTAAKKEAVTEKAGLGALIADRMLREDITLKEAVDLLAAEHRGSISKKELYSASLRLRSLINRDDG